jgi:site-specific DNA-cytosine methylase
VVVENVLGLLSSKKGRDFGRLLGELAGCGYDAEWQVLPAAAFGAPQLRKRVFLVAYTLPAGWGPEDPRECNLAWESGLQPGWKAALPGRSVRGIEAFPYANQATERVYQPAEYGEILLGADFGASDWWATEPGMGRMADGVSSRLDNQRYAGLGEAVVPQVAEFVGRKIVGWELGIRNCELGITQL